MIHSGFKVSNQIFSHEECQLVLEALKTACSLQAGTRNLMQNSTVQAIALDPRMIKIAQSFLGVNAKPFRATLFDKSPTNNWLVAWHQDTALPLLGTNTLPDWGPWSKKAGILYAQAPAWALQRVVALRLHLDKTTQYNGALRTIPNSHQSGILSHDAIAHLTKTSAASICEVDKGGVMAMRPLLVHASSKVSMDSPRRVLHIEYADSLDLQGIKLAIA